MTQNDEVLQLLKEMRAFEKGLFEIYLRLSTIFKKDYAFWHEISVDENTHVFMIDTFISLYRDHHITFQDRPFSSSVVKDEAQELEAFIDRIENEEISIKEALKFALQAENSIVEKKIFEYRDSDPAEFKTLLNDLYADSRKHYNKITEFYQNYLC